MTSILVKVEEHEKLLQSLQGFLIILLLNPISLVGRASKCYLPTVVLLSIPTPLLDIRIVASQSSLTGRVQQVTVYLHYSNNQLTLDDTETLAEARPRLQLGQE